jgi:alpha-1,6-mannosyltransferase
MRRPPPVRRKLINALPNLIPFIVLFSHVLLAPYTKVEESFTLHAVHDVLAYGLKSESYAHVRL